MFLVKICGVTSVEDARLAADAGADAIGLNFFPASPRSIRVEQAERIVDTLPAHITTVGVFVNEALDQVIRTYDQVGLDLIQLHGDEPPESLYALGERNVMQAFRSGRSGANDVELICTYLARCASIHRGPMAILVDAYQAGQFGGTGVLADWHFVRGLRTRLPAIPLVLAGGLNPDNVADAILAARPSAVDVASGVERSPGIKDPAKVQAFVRHAHAAFAGLPAASGH